MARKSISISALIDAAIAQGLTITGMGSTSKGRVAQPQAVEYKAEPSKSKAKVKGKKAGLRSNAGLKYTEGDDCCFCGAEFKGVKAVKVGENTRNRATFKGCKHTVNVY